MVGQMTHTIMLDSARGCDTLSLAHHTDVTTLETESDMTTKVKAQKEPQLMALATFVRRAILKRRDLSKSKGIHSVFSGFNDAMRMYYGWNKEEGIEAVNTLAEQDGVILIPRRHGPMLYLPGEGPKGGGGTSPKKVREVLADILSD